MWDGLKIFNVDGLAMPDIEPMKASDKAMAGSDQPDVIHSFIDKIFEKDDLFIQFFEELQSQLDWIDDKQIEKMIETLSYWNKEEDFSKMDKLTILYRYKQLI